MNGSATDSEKLDQIIAYLANVEKRISALESHLDVDSVENDIKLPGAGLDNFSERADDLENQIGQFWFAKVGIVILAIGIIFLLTFPYKNLPSGFPSLIGFVLVGIMFWLANYMRGTLQYLSQYIFGGSLLLLYFTTLRLHFFGENPAIENILLETILLTGVAAGHLFISYKKQSVYLTSIGLLLGSITALISNNSYSVFVFLVLLSLLVVYLKLKYEWNGLFIYGITLLYLTDLVWIINNPLIGNAVTLIVPPMITVLTVPVLAVIFSYGNHLIGGIETEDIGVIVSSILNCLLGYSLFLLTSILAYKSWLPALNLTYSVIFLSIAILFWVKRKSLYSTFFYSITAYTALSVAIVAQFPKPDFFVWLCWQSLLVVSTALWFRSRIIIVANFFMYLLIFIAYLFVAGTVGIVTLSFGFVALITARILNWQKNKLEFKTDIMRVSYLGAAFFIFPYALYHAVPKEFVSLAWTIVAIVYYLLSVLLKNEKYRWMALLTFILTVIHILLVGTSSLEPIYRIISFIVLGLVLLAVSIYYGKMKSSNVSKKSD